MAADVAAPREGTKFIEDMDSIHPYQPAAVMDDPEATTRADDETPRRSGTLKKRNSVKRPRSAAAAGGSTHDLQQENQNEQWSSPFYTPIPTQSNPTEVLVNRFQAWRKVLKDFLTYFREVQSQHEARAKGAGKLVQTLNGIARPNSFLSGGGVMDIVVVLEDFHKEASLNSGYAAKLETEVISQLVKLRGELALKVKEIKALTPDFKNNIEKEKENTRKEIQKLKEALESFQANPVAGKDPYLVKLGVEKQIRKQLNEENYLHRAYQNLEASGRELEEIVVGEIQKAYGAYVKLLAREGQEVIDLSDRLTASILRLPPDQEWAAFISNDPLMVNPNTPMRTAEQIQYEGGQNPAVLEVKVGILERKTKYLKSFAPAWYILSPTHLHEFKSADRARDPTPVMSLYLPDSTLGEHSQPAAVSHKFVLKAKQTGSLHRGHSWVFRAETHEQMLEWYNAIKTLIGVSGEERNSYVTRVASTASHQRTNSLGSPRANAYVSDHELDNDEADEVPYSGQPQIVEEPLSPTTPRRPEAGRFPSDMQTHTTTTSGPLTNTESGTSSSSMSSAAHGDLYNGHGMNSTAGESDEGLQPRSPKAKNFVVVRKPLHHARSHSASRSEIRDEPVEQPQSDVVDGTTQPVQEQPHTAGVTAFAIDPITGEPEQPVSPKPSHGSAPRAAFLGSDDIVYRSDSDTDPREPIPPEAADQYVLDSGSLDAVAVAPPLSAVHLSSGAGAPNTGYVGDSSNPRDVVVGPGAEATDGQPTGSVSQISIPRSMHIPGEYPNRIEEKTATF